MPHKLSIIVPGLCGPLPEASGIELSARPLAELLGNLGKHKTGFSSYPAQLADLFGIDAGVAVPEAALALLAFGHEPGDGCWLHADPVNLQADMNHALLSDARTLAIQQQEAEKLVAEINAHFAGDGLEVLIADPNNWFIRFDDCSLQTTPLRRAAGRNINQLMPAGAGAERAQRVLNEVQMLLHISPVNQAREQRGLLAINSLWLWGEGRLPSKGDPDITRVYADEPLARGLARLHQIEYSALTDPIALAHAMRQEGHCLAVLQQLDGPCSYSDVSAWLDEMLVIVDQWLEPLIETARLLDAEIFVYPCNGVRYHFSNKNTFRLSKLMFWKKHRLQDHVETP